MEGELKAAWHQLRRYAEDVILTHENAQHEVTSLQEKIDARGEVFGINNAVGQTLGMCYAAVREKESSCYSESLEAYQRYPNGMRSMASSGQLAEQLSGEFIKMLEAEARKK
ncbi:hypothetical protein E1267_26425 [Nonomuraea longispora]|uniref:Uncharacterized protein n=1 Tax=Nonomuraea longispora TaxID=1848320 RepID=A0A4V2XJP2_9ACTN|nr:hypothetical protein [Nonomuraea longispora]TDC03366.1 hypothetical protein E1267_26425 [Nonomuraea longispora]